MQYHKYLLVLPVGVVAEKLKPLRPAWKHFDASFNVMVGPGGVPFLVALEWVIEITDVSIEYQLSSMTKVKMNTYLPRQL